MKKTLFSLSLAVTVLLAKAGSAAAAPDTSVSNMIGERASENAVSQVSSVSELEDVDPNVWAFQALKSLVERYACIEGYPSKKYLGNRPLSRYEFAAGLNACLDKIGEQLAAATDPLATKDDLAVVQRLQEEFKTELATLRGRTDALEAKVKELEAQQFSTTTKLNATAVFDINGGGGSGNITPIAGNVGNGGSAASTSAGSANTTFGGRIRLNFDAKLNKDTNDLLKIRVATFPALGQDTSATLGAGTRSGQLFFGGQAPKGGVPGAAPVTNGNQTAQFDKVWYAFNPFKSNNFRVWVGPRVQVIDVLDKNPYLINDETRFSTTFNLFNPLISGYAHLNSAAGFDWKIGEQVSFRTLYSAANAGSSNSAVGGGGGITGGLTQLANELEYRPTKELGIKLQYTHASIPLFGASRRVFGPSAVFIGSNPVIPAIGGQTSSSVDAFGLNTDWAISESVKFFGRVAFATSQLNGGTGGNLNANTWLVGFELPDLFAKGNTAGISYGQPTKITSTSGLPFGADPSSENAIELYYSIKLTKGFTLTPDIQFISNPGNTSNPSLTIGTLRAVYTF
jgi:Carbohydrate-selective porin, OprB family